MHENEVALWINFVKSFLFCQKQKLYHQNINHIL